MNAASRLRVVGEDDDPVEWAVLRVNYPTRIRICLPTEDQARYLQREYPEGHLLRFSGAWLWVEPISPGVS